MPKIEVPMGHDVGSPLTSDQQNAGAYAEDSTRQNK